MTKRTKVTVGTAAAAVVIGAGALSGIAAANGGDDDQPLTGATRDKAVAAAQQHAGGGTVTETEVGDDGAAYEVELRMPDGSQIEVNLNEDFSVVGSEPDDDGATDSQGPDKD